MFGTLYEPVLIGIFYTKYKIAIVFFGEQIIEQCGSQASYVKGAGGTRCKTDTYFLTHNSVKFTRKDTFPHTNWKDFGCLLSVVGIIGKE